MHILLDTHLLLWSLYREDALPDQARRLIADESHQLSYSVISLWEVALKHESHPELLAMDPREVLDYCRQTDIHQLGLNDEAVLGLSDLRRRPDVPPHKDPFDRLLICQAKTAGMLFLTHDRLLTGYDEDCIRWV